MVKFTLLSSDSKSNCLPCHICSHQKGGSHASHAYAKSCYNKILHMQCTMLPMLFDVMKKKGMLPVFQGFPMVFEMVRKCLLGGGGGGEGEGDW